MATVIETLHSHPYPDFALRGVVHHAILKIQVDPDTRRVGVLVVENPGPCAVLLVVRGPLGGRRTEVIVPARTPSFTIDLPAAKRLYISWAPGSPKWDVSMSEV